MQKKYEGFTYLCDLCLGEDVYDHIGSQSKLEELIDEVKNLYKLEKEIKEKSRISVQNYMAWFSSCKTWTKNMLF